MPSTNWGAGQKPTILCIHGGGTTAPIFSIQTIRLRRELNNYFDFVFIDAPFVRGPGPGVLPTFEGADPFRGWIKMDDWRNNLAYPETVEVIQKAIQDQLTKTGKHFVGIMGFSEGGRLAAGIALRQQQLRQQKHPEATDEEDGFLFGVFLNATCPPLYLTPPAPLLQGESPPKITLPSVFSVGLSDEWKPQTRKLVAEHFDERNAKVLEFMVGHHLPTQKADTTKLANEIVNMYHRIVDF